MDTENFDNVNHIFGGIPEVKFNPEIAPEKNLDTLRPNLTRLGVIIGQGCKISNSTLKKLIENINIILSPARELSPELKLLLGNVKLNESAERLGEDLIASKKEKNMNIKIGAGVQIGEDVEIYTSVSIGENTQIGDHSKILTDSSIGKNCVIGRYSFIHQGCSIGDNVTIKDKTIFKPNTKIPNGSKVVHENSDSQMAKIE